MDDQTNEPVNEAAAEINALLTAASRGDTSVLPQLREFLDSRPDLWRKTGDLAAHAREAVTQAACHHDLLGAESMRRQMHELYEQLLAGSVEPLERLLVENCVLCWATMNLAELASVAGEREGVRQGATMQKKLSQIQGRFHAALKNLATMRKLLAPRVARPLRVVSDEVA